MTVPPHLRWIAAAASVATALVAVPAPTQASRREIPRSAVPAHPATTARATTGPGLTIDLAGAHPSISPLIYGVNFADATFSRVVRPPVDRWGGNGTETYNWQLRSSNTVNDYYWENIADCFKVDVCASNPTYSAAEAQIARDRKYGAATLLTLPAMGFVAKNAPVNHPFTCAFPQSGQQSYDQYDTHCGNGVYQGGTPVPANPTNAGVAAGPDISAAWIKHLVAKYRDARHGGVGIYELGNEPQLWGATDRGFHPAATTYDELWATSRDLALAVKGADPGAATLGPAEWGWPNYSCSEADDIDMGCFPSSPDRAQHGGIGLSQWYLQQFAAYQKAHGKRLLNYFDLHYYPAGYDTKHPLDVTRSLWDPHYTDPSYIDTAIRLIPRMRGWVAGSYPGTKTSLSEYNLGLDSSLSSRQQTLVEADALGIFGQQHLDLATFWAEDSSPIPTAAFGIYRNYDGKHHGFGNRLVSAVSGNRNRLAVYAARQNLHGTLTIMVVNKGTQTLRSRVLLRHRGPGKRSLRGAVYRYTGGAIRHSGSVIIGRQGFRATFPAQSVSLVAIPKTG